MRFLSALHRSWYDPAFYREVAVKWRGSGLAYLLILLGGLFLPLYWHMQQQVKPITKQLTTQARLPQTIEDIIGQFPPLHIENGTLRMEAETSPYTVHNPENGTPVLTIDTRSGHVPFTAQQGIILIRADRILIAHPSGTPVEIALNQLLAQLPEAQQGNFTISRETLHGWAEDTMQQLWIVPWATYLYQWFAEFLDLALRALFYAIAGMLFAPALRISLSFKTIYRTCVAALTPIAILEGLESALQTIIFGWKPLVYLVITLWCLNLAIKGNRVSNHEKV